MFPTLWTVQLDQLPRGLCLARESSHLLTWYGNWLVWFNASGKRQAQTRLPKTILTAAISEDSSACASAEEDGRVCWFQLDLQPIWEKTLTTKPTALTFDPLGTCLIVADMRGNVILWDRQGKEITRLSAPRAVHHLSFLPITGQLVAAADLSWVALADLTTRSWLWRDTPFVNIAHLAVAPIGQPILLSCYSEAVRIYRSNGHALEGLAIPSSKQVVPTYDGKHFLAITNDNQLVGIHNKSYQRIQYRPNTPPLFISLSSLGDTAYLISADATLQALDTRKLIE